MSTTCLFCMYLQVYAGENNIYRIKMIKKYCNILDVVV